MQPAKKFLTAHARLTRRYFMRTGIGAAVSAPLWSSALLSRAAAGETPADDAPISAPLAEAIAKLETYFTRPADFQDVSRGKPIPHSLPEDKKREVGLTRDSWRLEVISDPEHPAAVRKPLTKADGSALDFEALMRLADKHAVRFAKVMTCLNIGCPLGMGIWEGVPLREVVWLTRPGDNVRRVFYYGYHNDDPQQIFQSSLPIGRVLEDPFDLPPVILCYKLNGEWLSPERGGPVRVVVPEAYGFKCIKWLSHVVLTNLAYANDTYANENNDVDSPLKSFAATLSIPSKVKSGASTPVTGYAQVGIGGLSKVQFWIQPDGEESPAGDPYFNTAPWQDAKILSAPEKWGGGLAEDRVPADTAGFDAAGHPLHWPLRLTKVHWAVVLPGLSPGKYTFRCRAVDERGNGQPMPRPFRKSGHATIEQMPIIVE